jgi:hypothetical protein
MDALVKEWDLWVFNMVSFAAQTPFPFPFLPELTARKSACRDRCNRESFLLVWEWLMSLNYGCLLYHLHILPCHLLAISFRRQHDSLRTVVACTDADRTMSPK